MLNKTDVRNAVCQRKPSRNCCLVRLFKEKKEVAKEEIVQYCCVERCEHDAGYHNERCPIKLVGINTRFPMNQNSTNRAMHVQIPDFQPPDDNNQKQLSDF